jgi:23S rRNA (cytidine1920-2'-O)/16S rRNA (cytidine1409-2'-O)-methyltransferase
VVEHGLADDLIQARALLMTGRILVDAQPAQTPGTLASADAKISLKEAMPYVSRGGYKLAAALQAFAVNPVGASCADVGASTGGFTDVLLQQGADRVYAIDVGYGDLAWKLRQDPRVVVMERTNARRLEALPEQIDLVVIDASFISLKRLLAASIKWTKSEADFIGLVKPQFEAPKDWVEKGGVVKSSETHRLVLKDVMAWAGQQQFAIAGLISSPILGPAGNREFLLHLVRGRSISPVDLEVLIESCLLTAVDH